MPSGRVRLRSEERARHCRAAWSGALEEEAFARADEDIISKVVALDVVAAVDDDGAFGGVGRSTNRAFVGTKMSDGIDEELACADATHYNLP
eukprot:6189702-Pleurochrysis_carterae.AAC.1